MSDTFMEKLLCLPEFEVDFQQNDYDMVLYTSKACPGVCPACGDVESRFYV